MPELTIGIRIYQRIIYTIRIPVETLREIRHLHERVGTQEPCQQWVVHTAVHVDQLEFVQMFVTRIATVEFKGIIRYCALAPNIIGSFEYFITGNLCQRHNTAQMVFISVVGLIGLTRFFHADSNQAVIATDIIQSFRDTVLSDFLIITRINSGASNNVVLL